jgi:hypothetical protein
VRPTRATVDGRAYLDLQNKARGEKRPTDELLALYALEGFLTRLAGSAYSDSLVLKGGVLLAAFDARRTTRDIDLQASAVSNDVDTVLGLICEIAALATDVDDGLVFDTGHATAEVIRDEDEYSGVRVSLTSRLSQARITVHVDVNVGDPVWPAPEHVELPRLLGGTINLRGFPMPMVYAEKLVNAVARGTANTRWRDFGDVYVLSGIHPVTVDALRAAIGTVAAHRGVGLAPLKVVLDEYEAIAQSRYAAWRRRHRRDELPAAFADLLSAVIDFADPVLAGQLTEATWEPERRAWR